MTLHRRAALGALAVAGTAPLWARPAAALDADEFAATMLRSGAKLHAMSELARTRTDTEPVGIFATLEIAEQEALAEVLAGLGAPMPELDPEAAAEVEALALLEGGAFNQDYLAAQRAGHLEALQLVETAAAFEPTSVPGLTARLAKAGIEGHLAMIDMIVGNS